MYVTVAAGRRARLSLEATVARFRGRLGPESARRRRVAGEARALDPRWLPPSPRAAVPSPLPGRVLNLLESSLPHVTAGYAQRSRAVCAAQRRCGLAPAVATRLGFPASRGIACEPVEVVDGVEHHRLSIPGLRHYTAIPRDRQLKHNVDLAMDVAAVVRPALLWSATPHLNGVVGLALRSRLGVPLVYDVRGFPDLTWLTERGGAAAAREHAERLRAAELRCMREADAVVTLSETMRAEVAARGLDVDRVHVLPHAVDTADVEQQAELGRDLRRRLGLRGLVVGHASTLRRYEGGQVLLRAVSRAREQRPEIACMVVGDGPARAELERLADELGLADAVRFTGRVDAGEMPAYHAACDVVAVPRLAAPVCERVTPLKLYEALAAGRAVIASALAPLEEAAAGAARLVPPGDAEALARELVELAADPDGRARLGRRALEVAARHGEDRLDHAVARVIACLGVDLAIAEAAR